MMHVSVPYHDSITFRVNDYQIEERNSVGFHEAERLAGKVREALTQVGKECEKVVGTASTAAAHWAHRHKGEGKWCG